MHVVLYGAGTDSALRRLSSAHGVMEAELDEWLRDGVIVAYFANCCHSADIGGHVLSAEATEVFEEGLRVPVTKLFEYEVKGTLGRPVAEPRYIPRFLMLLLKPTSLLKELLPGPPAEGLKEGGRQP